jgi:hypothetical protein
MIILVKGSITLDIATFKAFSMADTPLEFPALW